jgi:hypothetical protein
MQRTTTGDLYLNVSHLAASSSHVSFLGESHGCIYFKSSLTVGRWVHTFFTDPHTEQFGGVALRRK